MRFITDVALPYQGSDCLLWPYAKIGSGYGHVKVDDKDVLVTRYVCTVVNGPPPTPDHEAAHSCGSGHLGCITKRHLSWKTPAENQADRLLHGTDNRGERHGRAKLTEDQAREILSLRGKLSQRKIAAKYGVSHSTISLIHLRRNWAWM